MSEQTATGATPNKDNWSNMGTYCCGACFFFVPKRDHDSLGRCRRRAPTMNGFPAVYKTDWCGDHKLDERKIDT